MTSVVIAVAIALLVLLQGGYFSLATCAAGVVVSLVAGIAALRKARRRQPIPIAPLLLAGLALSYFASTLTHGATLTTLAETGAWAATAGMAFLVAAQDVQQRAKTLRLTTWFGVVTSVAGVLVCARLLPVYGGMVEDRLQLTFQYANAAAIWYGACLFLCLLSPDAWLRAVACLPALALCGARVSARVCAPVHGRFPVRCLIDGAYRGKHHRRPRGVRAHVPGQHVDAG